MNEENSEEMDSSGSGSGPKRGLQEMSKEELIQKCKALLNLAQKAKSAKDGKKNRLLVCFLFFLL